MSTIITKSFLLKHPPNLLLSHTYLVNLLPNFEFDMANMICQQLKIIKFVSLNFTLLVNLMCKLSWAEPCMSDI